MNRNSALFSLVVGSGTDTIDYKGYRQLLPLLTSPRILHRDQGRSRLAVIPQILPFLHGCVVLCNYYNYVGSCCSHVHVGPHHKKKEELYLYICTDLCGFIKVVFYQCQVYVIILDDYSVYGTPKHASFVLKKRSQNHVMAAGKTRWIELIIPP